MKLKNKIICIGAAGLLTAIIVISLAVSTVYSPENSNLLSRMESAQQKQESLFAELLSSPMGQEYTEAQMTVQKLKQERDAASWPFMMKFFGIIATYTCLMLVFINCVKQNNS